MVMMQRGDAELHSDDQSGQHYSYLRLCVRSITPGAARPPQYAYIKAPIQEPVPLWSHTPLENICKNSVMSVIPQESPAKQHIPAMTLL